MDGRKTIMGKRENGEMREWVKCENGGIARKGKCENEESARMREVRE